VEVTDGSWTPPDALGYLANDILVKVDRTTMAHGLESRAPYLMPRLAEYALGLPATAKCGAVGKTKRILRSLMMRKFGSDLANAKKQGFFGS
jgi:asparagine synthase (glutamine-hydrolysing)